MPVLVAFGFAESFVFFVEKGFVNDFHTNLET